MPFEPNQPPLPGSPSPAPPPSGLPPRPPIPSPIKKDHTMPGEQFTVPVSVQSPAPVPTPGAVASPQQPGDFQPQPQPAAPPQPVQPYDFIMSADQKPPHKLSLPGGNSLLSRVLLVSGLLFVLLIGFVFIRGLLSGSSDQTSFFSIAQDQQAMIHLTTEAGQQKNTATSIQDFVATAQLGLTSSQKQIIEYMTINKQKVDQKKLGLKISSTTDEQLTTAAAATTYDQTFRAIMKGKLEDYAASLSTTYDSTKGPKGRAMLTDQYKQAKLLILQLDQSSTSATAL